MAHVSDESRRRLGVDGFFAVPTLTGRILFVFVVLHHHRRQIVHVNVTDHPTAAWTAQQMIAAFPHDTARRAGWRAIHDHHPAPVRPLA